VIWDKARFAESVESRSGTASLGQGTGITGVAGGDYACWSKLSSRFPFLQGGNVREAKGGVLLLMTGCCSRYSLYATARRTATVWNARTASPRGTTKPAVERGAAEGALADHAHDHHPQRRLVLQDHAAGDGAPGQHRDDREEEEEEVCRPLTLRSEL
jgi:hypothetical protein